MPGRARLAPARGRATRGRERRLLGQQVGVGADDRERRPQLVGDEGDQLAAGLVDRLERLDPGLGLASAGGPSRRSRRAGRRRRRAGRRRASLKSRGCSVWTLRTPTIWSCQVSGTDSIEATNRRWSMPRTHRKRGSALTSGMTSGSRVGGDAPGHALAERHPRPADLEAIEAVGRGQGQVRSVAIEQVERGDVGVERVAGPVDDRLEQLVPGPRRRRQAGDLVQEPELLELVRAASRTRAAPASPRPTSRARGLDRVVVTAITIQAYGRLPAGTVADAVAARTRNGPRPDAARMTAATRRAPSPAVARRAGRDRDGRRPRSARASRSGCSARCSARSSPSRPGRSSSRSSSGSGGGRSRCAATTIRASARGSTTTSAALDLGDGRGRHPRLRPLLPAGQPGRGARPGPRRCAAASAPRATASSTTRSPTPSRRLRRLGRDRRRARRARRPAGGLAGPDRPPDRGAPADDARRPAPLRRACSSGSTTRA